MPFITLPNTFVAQTKAQASQVNANFTAVTAVVNGQIDNSNIAAGAAISISKIDLTAGGAAFNKATTGVTTWASGLTTDTQPRIAMTADVGLRFGAGGVTVVDTEIIRSAAKTLQFNDTAAGAITLDLNLGAITALASIALKNTFSATITPAALAANRAVTMIDPGAAVNLVCADSTLVNHDLVKFDGSRFQRIAVGTASKRIVSNGTDWVSTLFTSADQTITAAGALTLAHSLGYAPTQVWFSLVNVTGEAGYTTGQVVQQGGVTSGTANQGFSAIMDATNLTVRFGSAATTFTVPHATTGAATALTNANWTIRFYAV